MDQYLLQIIVGTLIGLGAGYLGSFMVLRRMALVGDALSHVALPGIALAILFGFNPFLGAFATLFASIIGIWVLEKKTDLPSETLVGILFTLSLALGLLLTPEPELLEALFGDISKITSMDAVISAGLVLSVILIMARISKGIVLGIISKDMTKSMGLSIETHNLAFLFVVALVVALGLKVAGTLLMGSLVIIPAAAARNIGVNLSKYTLASGIFGAVAGFGGVIIAQEFSIAPGPAVVITGGVIFLASLIFKK